LSVEKIEGAKGSTMSKRDWSDTEKQLIVLEILKGQKSVCQLAKEYGISDSLAYRWRDEALQAIKERFSKNGRKSHTEPQAERDRLLKIVGEQAVVIDTLKKISAMS